VEAILIVPENGNDWVFANLIDRPFLCHVVEFMVDNGITKILILGPAADRAHRLLSASHPWGISFDYCQNAFLSGKDLPPMASGRTVLLAAADCLPLFPLKRYLTEDDGKVLCGKDGSRWTGWALIRPCDFLSMPVLNNRPGVLSWLENLRAYERVPVDYEFRSGNAVDLWRSHKVALDSNLSTLHHEGIEVKPGVWIARNASIAATSGITPPIYIGENSKISAGARIGPFAVVGRDCLISPRTTVCHSVMAPGTYVGDNFTLEGVFVNKSELFDIRSGAQNVRADPAMLDGVFDFRWSELPRQVCEILALPVLFLCAAPTRILSSTWHKIQNRRWRNSGIPGSPAASPVKRNRPHLELIETHQGEIDCSRANTSPN